MNNKLLFYLLLFYFLPQIVEKESGLTSLRIKAEKEKELQEAEAYWSKRFAKQEQEVRITITYSVIHISIHPSKELCSKMAPGEVGVSLP